MEYNNDFRHDLKVGQVAEKELGNIFQDATIEVKYDQQYLRTGNFYIEYISRDKPSCIATSTADYWALTGDLKQWIIIETQLLKQRLKEYRDWCEYEDKDPAKTWQVKGGDSNTSIGFLVKARHLCR